MDIKHSLCGLCVFARPLFFSFILLSAVNAFSQELLHCGADEMRYELVKSNPALLKAIANRDAQLEKFTKQYVQQNNLKQANTPIYTIPVVFHVIHNYGPENISDAQILDGLNILNKYYQKLMPDTNQIIAAFKPLHADCNIEFKLATKDPNGNCTRGVNRIQSNFTYTGTHDVKSLIHWDPAKYLNIYIVSNAAGLAGHCVWPADADTIPAWDGIVISHNYVGSFGTSNPTQQVTLSHEVGHYFNLQHTWGGNNVPGYYFLPCADPNKDCSIDDGVSDTPTTIGWTSCKLNGASCGSTLDNVQNFMEYSYCNKMFTYGQRARMHACLNSNIANRNNLWTPANLTATGVSTSPGMCAADFSINRTYACAGDSVLVRDSSYSGIITSYLWQCAGATVTNPTAKSTYIKFSTAGSYSISLTVSDGTISKSVTKNNSVTIAGTSYNLPFTESFDARTALPDNDWIVINNDSAKTFELHNTSGINGSKCAWINNFNNISKRKEELISPAINYPLGANLHVTFKCAFAQQSTTDNDKLLIYVSKDCGKTWVLRSSKTAAMLAAGIPLTTGTSFYPSNSQWNTFSITNINSSFASPNLRLKFVFESDLGNNFFLDDINVDVVTGIESITQANNAFIIYPNPANKQITLEPIISIYEAIEVDLYDISSRKVKSTRISHGTKENIDIMDLKAGIYFLLVRKENAIIYHQKISIE